MSTLSSVVSDIVRASQSSATEDDLDRHVADLIIREAKQKLQKYNTDGIRAYLPQPDSNVPKANKRFLSSIIRSTDDHNKTILRAQALAAQEARQERLEQERRERKARAEEAAEAERMRRLMGKGGVQWSHNWDRGKDRERRTRDRSRERKGEAEKWHRSRKGKEREREDYEEERRSRRYRSKSPNREESCDSRRRYRREQSSSRSPSPALSSEDSRERHRERKQHRRSRHRRSRPSRSREDSDTERPKHRSHRRHRDLELSHKSPSRAFSDNHESELQQPEEQTISISVDDHAQPSGDTDIHLGGEQHHASRSPSPPRKSKRKRSPSPEIGPQLPPEDLASTSYPREDEVRRRLKTHLDLNVPKSSATSRISTPAISRSSSKPKEAVDIASTSSRTLPSARASSPSVSSRPGSPPPKRSRHRSTKVKDAPPQPPSSPPPLPAHLPSKMDKYFDDDYDPRLDVAPLTVPTIPATGLISDAEFAGWDAMLEIIRQRREDKEEKKRLERWGITPDNEKKKKGAEGTSEAVDIMSIEYKKRGSVREWDLGKEGF